MPAQTASASVVNIEYIYIVTAKRIRVERWSVVTTLTASMACGFTLFV